MATDHQILLARTHLASARYVTVLTGAGISADSGVPTFRGADGLWRTYRAEDLATPEAFERDPRLVWEWYNWRRELIATKQPNPAHIALVELERRTHDTFWLITQNVDGLHRTAGSQRLSEIHGNIWKVRCTGCSVISENREIPLPILPTCHLCHALRACDLLLVIGTSGVVYPAAGFASMAKDVGASVIEINLEITPQSDLVDLSLQGRAKDLVPLLL
jgi:NAD-dependent deacetylase